MYVLILRIQVVQDDISVAGVTGGKDDDFEVFAQILEDLLGVGSDVDSCLYDFSGGEGDRQFDIVGWSQSIIAVDQCLIQIENYRFFAYISLVVPSEPGFL